MTDLPEDSFSEPLTVSKLKKIDKLVDPWTGIFNGIPDETLGKLLPFCKIIKASEKYMFYSEGDDLDTIYFVIDGGYRLGQKVNNKDRVNVDTIPVAKHDEVIVFGEAEFLLKTNSAGNYEVNTSGKAHARVSVTKKGRVLAISPAQSLFDTEDFQLIRNLCRILCVKVIRRSFALEEKWTSSITRLIVMSLSGYVKLRIDNKERELGVFVLNMNAKEMAELFGVDESQISRAKNRIVKRIYDEDYEKYRYNFYDNFSWEGANIVFQGALLEKMLEDPIGLAKLVDSVKEFGAEDNAELMHILMDSTL